MTRAERIRIRQEKFQRPGQSRPNTPFCGAIDRSGSATRGRMAPRSTFLGRKEPDAARRYPECGLQSCAAPREHRRRTVDFVDVRAEARAPRGRRNVEHRVDRHLWMPYHERFGRHAGQRVDGALRAVGPGLVRRSPARLAPVRRPEHRPAGRSDRLLHSARVHAPDGGARATVTPNASRHWITRTRGR